jgi:hypothetical protein
MRWKRWRVRKFNKGFSNIAKSSGTMMAFACARP